MATLQNGVGTNTGTEEHCKASLKSGKLLQSAGHEKHMMQQTKYGACTLAGGQASGRAGRVGWGEGHLPDERHHVPVPAEWSEP